MCTDNMPSGTALKMGDVLTVRGGTTVEVVNTDAEGRLVMSDALVLATEEPTDAVVTIATLTGAALRALGTEVAAVMGTDQGLVDQLRAAGDTTDEPLWQLPMVEQVPVRDPLRDRRPEEPRRSRTPGSITAALFLAEFVGDLPFAHVDIAGTAEFPAASTWRTAGCTGFGARLLVEAALDFTPPAPERGARRERVGRARSRGPRGPEAGRSSSGCSTASSGWATRSRTRRSSSSASVSW